jgi:hypothetical protein
MISFGLKDSRHSMRSVRADGPTLLETVLSDDGARCRGLLKPSERPEFSESLMAVQRSQSVRIWHQLLKKKRLGYEVAF